MNIGFTGTSIEVTPQQYTSLTRLITVLAARGRNVHAAHHGDCIEGDALFHNIVLSCMPHARIIIHPPTNNKARAFCEKRPRSGDEIRKPFAYLTRNRHIVDESDLLIAMPFTHTEQLRSGTWSTVRYARQKGIPIIKILPDGNFSAEGDVGDIFSFANSI